MGNSDRTSAALGWAALVTGVAGYVLLFYVRSPLLPVVGLLLIVAAVPLAIVAIARSRRRLTTAVGVLAIVPLAILISAVWSWLST